MTTTNGDSSAPSADGEILLKAEMMSLAPEVAFFETFEQAVFTMIKVRAWDHSGDRVDDEV